MSKPITELLACPACGGDLAETPEGLACAACGRTYSSPDGVPNLLLAPPPDSERRSPSLAGRALQSVVAIPVLYDLAQRLAGREKLFRRIRPVLAHAEGALVLDAGAGTGSTEALLPRSAGYLWLDADPQKLSGFRAKSRSPAVLGDGTRIPLKNRSVDWALSVGVSHHLDDAELGRMLDEFRRVVRERVFFLDAVVTPALRSRLLWHYDRGRHPRTSEALKKELAARFSIVSEEEFTILHRYLLVTAR